MQLALNLDLWINTQVSLVQNPLLIEVMIFITNIASPTNLSLLSILVLGIFIIQKRWHATIFLFSAMASGLILGTGLKLLIGRERPLNSLIEVTGFSFPSGHATMATVFFLSLIILFKDKIRNKLHTYFFITASIVLFLLIGISRIYLNVHWTSDVLAGFLLGGIIVLTINRLLNK